MSDPNPSSDPVTDSVTNSGADLLAQKLKDDPALLKKLIAGLTLAETANPTGLLDLVTSVVNAGGNILNSGNEPVEKVNATNNPLFFNSNKSGSSFYSVKNGWGIQKEGDKIHTFDYEVISKLGRAGRVFGTVLGLAAGEVVAAVAGFKNGLTIIDASLSEEETMTQIKAQEDEMDLKTAAAREKLATLIVAAYTDVVQSKSGDMVSFVLLAEMSLLTMSNDVKMLAGSQKHIGGIALALVTDLVATGTASSIKRKANARKAFFHKNTVSTERIVILIDQYRNKFYKSILPRYESEAVMAEAGITGGKGDDWLVQITSKAPTIEGLRSLSHKELETIFTSGDVSPIDQKKVNQMFAGIIGGGDIPIARKNLVEAGIDVKTVYAMEQEAKKEGTTVEQQSQEDVWKSVKTLFKEGSDKFRAKIAENIEKANEKTVEEKAANVSLKQVGLTAAAGLFDGATGGAAGVVGMIAGSMPGIDPVSAGIAIAQALEATAEKNAKKLADDIKASNEDRESALSDAEELIKSMSTMTGPALTAKQKEVATLLNAVVAPSGFGKSRMTGIAQRQLELESMSSTKFAATNMNTLKPYETYSALVAGANGGRALRSVALYLKKDEPIVTASRILLQPPKKVTMTSPDMAFRSTFQRTSNEEEMNSFINTVQTSGLATASKEMAKKSKSASVRRNLIFAQAQASRSTGSVRKSSNSATSATDNQGKEESQALATEAVISEIVFMPMKSFFLQESAMQLTTYASKLYSKATTPEAAKRFIKAYGTHIPFGTQTMGGMFIRTMKITTTEDHDMSTLYKAVSAELKAESAKAEVANTSAGIQKNVFGLGGGITAASQSEKGAGTGETDRDARADGTGTQYGIKNASFESNIVCFGPKAKTADDLYQQLMKNNATWTIIDRGETSSYLPIWELMESTRPLWYEKQNQMVSDTWKKMARKNCTPEDVDLYEMIMDDNSVSSVYKILHYLVKCLVPIGSSNYDKDLADTFETTMKGAAKEVLVKIPKSLQEFIGLVGTDAFAFVEQTEAYGKAQNYFYDLEIEDMQYFNPDNPVYTAQTSSSPYLAAAEYITNRGRNVLLAACEETLEDDISNFRLFIELYDFYKGKDESLLNKQMQARGTHSGRNSFHYVAQYGSETLIKKVLELDSEWTGPGITKDEYLKIVYDTEEGSVTTLSLLKGRHELTEFMLKLEPPPEAPIVPKTLSLKEKMKEKLESRKGKLDSVHKHAEALFESSGGKRRNWLAEQASKKQLERMVELIGNINTSTKTDIELLIYAKVELGRLRDSAKSSAEKFNSYLDKIGNDYAESVCYEAAEIFGLAKNDLNVF